MSLEKDTTDSDPEMSVEDFVVKEEEGTEEIEGELISDYESVPCEFDKGELPKGDLTPKELLQQFKHEGVSLYDHIKKLLELLISTRPSNTIDYFDQYSRAVREPKARIQPTDHLESALKQARMFGSMIVPRKFIDTEEMEEEDEIKVKKFIANFMESADYFQEMNVGLPKTEIYQIDTAIRSLGQRDGILKARFWGKIFGIERNYIVAECELTRTEVEQRLREQHERMDEGEEQEEEEEEQAVPEQPRIFSSFLGFSSFFAVDAEEQEIEFKKLHRYRMPPIPMPEKKKVIKMKKEELGEGANKRVYYICHEPGDEWVQLPLVLPEHIVTARQIRRYFRGYLSADVGSFPPFPGKEREYLRAQIARISAGTHISPIGFYQFGSLDEMEAEDNDMTELIFNLDFETIPYQDLLTTAFWVHHVPHILRIGRTTYYTPPKFMGEEMEEEEDQEPEETKPKEVGPPLLTPLSEDLSMFDIEPWTIKGTSSLIPGSGAIGVRSNLWPGAYCVAKDRYFENVYLGHGLKYTGEGFSPWRPPFPEKEYGVVPEITEATDPTPEEEEEWRQAHKPPPLPVYRGEEGEEELGPIYTEPESDN